MASNEVRTAWSALAAIDGYLGNKEKDATLMKPHVDQFLIAISLQLRMAYTKLMTGKRYTIFKQHDFDQFLMVVSLQLPMAYIKQTTSKCKKDIRLTSTDS